MKNKGFWQKAGAFFSGKGFYMVLAVCLCAIGVSGWYLWQTVQLAGDSLAEQVSGSATVTAPEGEDAPPEQTSSDGSEDSAETLFTADEGDTEALSALEGTDNAADAAGEPTDSAAEESTAGGKDGVSQTAAEGGQDTSAGTQQAVETSVETVDNLHQTMQYPVPGTVVSAFSSDTLVYNEAMEDWRTHDGVDLAAQVGDTVTAAWAGKVTSVQQDAVLGTVVTVDCGDGYTVIYGNLAEETAVSAGDSLSAGDPIGTVGETAAGESNGGAAFLHFAVMQDGQYIDPMAFLEE